MLFLSFTEMWCVGDGTQVTRASSDRVSQSSRVGQLGKPTSQPHDSLSVASSCLGFQRLQADYNIKGYWAVRCLRVEGPDTESETKEVEGENRLPQVVL